MKNRMKFFLYATFIFFVFLSTGCSKDEENPGEYYIRFEANGNKVEYNNQISLTAGFGQSGNQYVGTVSGWNDASSNITLILYDIEPITESTYSGYTASINGVMGVVFSYKEKESGAVFSSGVAADHDARITLSEITETGVRGTFGGTITTAGQPDINITEGSFFVKRVLN